MPHGAGEDPLALTRPDLKKIFVGKGKLELPMLRKTLPPLTEKRSFTNTSADEGGPPSPCSSTSLSCFSSTSDEAIITPEFSCRHTHQSRWSEAKQTERRHIYGFDLKKQRENHVSNLQSIVIGYPAKPTKEDFIPPSRPTESKISSLSGLTILPNVSKKKSMKESVFSKYRRNSAGSKHVVTAFRARKGYYASRGSLPGAFSVAKPPSENFVQAIKNRTPPPDFIERDSLTSDNVQTISYQPDLSVLLSGAVSKSALLKGKSGFVPTAVMPIEQLRAKSKSLSDISKQEEKMRRFLDRRKVIQMNLKDEDCCSHTEVAPSSMMTLAMELLVARDNKAATLFNDAKKKTDCTVADSDSILPKLWIVPKAHSSESDKNTASHLKPILKPSSKVNFDHKMDEKNKDICQKLTCGGGLVSTAQAKSSAKGDLPSHSSTKCMQALSNQDKSNQEPFGVLRSGVRLRKKPSEYSYPTTKCVALSEQKVDDLGNQGLGSSKEQILQEDVERDLKTLTVALLVGSPDTLYTDTRSGLDSEQCESRGTSKCQITDSARIPIELPGKGRNTLTTALYESPEHSLIANVRKAQSGSEVRSMPIECDSKGNEESVCPFDSEITSSHVTTLEANVDSKHERERKRRSSSVSISSSLTTVSSLSLSSASTASLELFGGKNILKTSTDYPTHQDSDFETVKLGHNKANLHQSSQEPTFRAQDTLPEADDVLCLRHASHALPQPLRRRKSFEVMDKLRKTRQRKEDELSKDNWAEYREALKLADCGKDHRTLRQNKFGREDCRTGKLTEKAMLHTTSSASLQNTNDVKIVKQANIQNSKHIDAVDVQLEERHQSHLLLPSDMPESLYVYSKDDTRGRVECARAGKEIPAQGDDISSAKNTEKERQGEIPIHKRYCGTDICLTSPEGARYTKHLCEGISMTAERLFRNGEISVVDGSKVCLARKDGQDFTKNDLQSRYNKQSAGVYLSDLINVEDSQQFENYPNRPSEEDYITPSSASFLESDRQIINSFHERQETPDVTNQVDENFATRRETQKSCENPLKESKVIRGNLIRLDDPDHYFPTYHCAGSMSTNYVAEPSTGNRSPKAFPKFSEPARLSQHTQSRHGHRPSPIESAARQGTTNKSVTHSPYDHDVNQTAGANRNATPYTKNSALKLLTSKNVYTSCVKISLNPSKLQENVSKKELQEVNAPPSERLDFGCINVVMRRPGDKDVETRQDVKPPLRNNSPSNELRRQKNKNVREVISSDMKVTESLDVEKPELPPHSAVDEGDFAGVVDGPTKNVKEIRAMFKGPDYVNYAKPRMLAKTTSSGQTTIISSTGTAFEHAEVHDEARLRNDVITRNVNRNSAEVAQQVIGLFKGALTLDDETTDSPTSIQQIQAPSQNGETVGVEPHISIKDKVASFNSGKSPVKEIEINNNSNKKEEVVPAESNVKPLENVPHAEIITNSSPLANEHVKKSSVKQEKVNADSYDESLDQFYDVLEELTAS